MMMEESLQRPDLSNYARVSPGATPQPQPPIESDSSGFFICTPPLSFAFPDGLRHFTRQGIPNYRMIPPKVTALAFNP